MREIEQISIPVLRASNGKTFDLDQREAAARYQMVLNIEELLQQGELYDATETVDFILENWNQIQEQVKQYHETSSVS